MEYNPSSSHQVVKSVAIDFAHQFPHLAASAHVLYLSSSHELVGCSPSDEPLPGPVSQQAIPPAFFARGEPLHLVKLFARSIWPPSSLGLAHLSSPQTPWVETLTHLSRFDASQDDGAVFVMEENCLLVWCTAQGSSGRLRDTVQWGLNRMQDDLSGSRMSNTGIAPSEALGPITLDFNNGPSNALDMSDLLVADGLFRIDAMDASSVYGSPSSDFSPVIHITSPLMPGCHDFLLSSPPDSFQYWRSPQGLTSTFPSPCVDPRLISPSSITLEDVAEDSSTFSTSPFSSGSSAGGDELSDVGTPFSPMPPLPSPEQDRLTAQDEAASKTTFTPRFLSPSPAKSPRTRETRVSPPYRKPSASHKSSKKQRFICECGKSYSRDKDRERHQETSCALIKVKPTVVCDSSARCNPKKRARAVA
ncbi:unnamed protein product [Peniophora sp. CBMAI 1063]|nr:unnamed protein product [Peniophora sp. CBMAI 1063]